MLSLIFLDNFQLITVSSFSHVAKFCLLILWRPFLSMSMRDSGFLFLFFSLWCLFLGLVSGKNPNLNVLTGKFYQIFKEQILLIFHILFQKIEEWTFQLTLRDHSLFPGCCCCSVTQSCPTLCHPMCCSPRLPHSRDFPGKNTGVDFHFLLQGIFLTQGLNLGLLHCRQTLYCVSHQGSPVFACLVQLNSCFWGREFASSDSDSKEAACNAGDPGSISGLGRSPGGGNGNPFQ